MQVLEILLPAELSVVDSLRYLFGQVDGGEIVMRGHLFVIRYFYRHNPFSIVRHLVGVDKMHQHHIHGRIRFTGMPHDSFHSQNLGLGREAVGAVVDGSLFKKQIYFPVFQHIPFEPEGAGSTAHRTDSRRDEIELRARESLFQVSTDTVAPA